MEIDIEKYLNRFNIHMGLMNLGVKTVQCYDSIAKQFFYGLTKSPYDVPVEEIEILLIM